MKLYMNIKFAGDKPPRQSSKIQAGTTPSECCIRTTQNPPPEPMWLNSSKPVSAPRCNA